ncbi:MAG: sulfotransferase domain-containing protein [Phycisphaerales bacterium]|nr:sulfotransferase domain-containing protein [Phycisphaerales bacterium]MCI0675789.1 sulfotransferase domain-containing protein [Phycisphaerales bacterium]
MATTTPIAEVEVPAWLPAPQADALPITQRDEPVVTEALPPKLYFLHIMKTAGTTLKSLIEQNYPMDLIPPCTPEALLTLESERLGIPKSDLDKTAVLSAFRYICSHTNMTEILPEGFQWITVLRDPVARLRSLFRHWQTFTDAELDGADRRSGENKRSSQLKRLSRSKTLEEFLAVDDQIVLRNFHNGMAKTLVGHYPRCKPDFLSDDELLAEAKSTIDRMLCVGLTEQFEQFVRLLSYRTGWPRTPSVQPLNVRLQMKPAKPDEDLPAIVREAVRLDRVIYDYGRGAFERQFNDMLNEVAVLGSSNGHVKSPSPPTSGDLDAQLDRLSVESLVDRAAGRSLPERVHIQMRQAVRGTGWLEREGRDVGRIYRWTGPGRRSTVDLLIAAAPQYVLELRVISVIHEDILHSAVIHVNDVKVPVVVAHALGARILRGIVPGSAIGPNGFARIHIEVPRTTAHSEVDPACTDTRQKGLAIDTVELRVRRVETFLSSLESRARSAMRHVGARLRQVKAICANRIRHVLPRESNAPSDLSLYRDLHVHTVEPIGEPRQQLNSISSRRDYLDRVNAFLCSYPKCGRTWLRFMLCNYINDCLDLRIDLDLHTMFSLLPNDTVKVSANGVQAFPYLERADVPLILATHSSYRPKPFGFKPIILLLRSPNDALWSWYCECVASKNVDQQTALSDFLREGKRNTLDFAQYINGWAENLHNHRSLVITFEKLKADGPDALRRIVEFLGLPVRDTWLQRACEKSSIERMRSLEQDRGLGDARQIPNAIRVRNGAVGDHVGAFGPAELAFTRQIFRQSLNKPARALLRDGGLLQGTIG